MNSKNEGQRQISSRNVVKRGKGVLFAEVFENKQKINEIITFTNPNHRFGSLAVSCLSHRLHCASIASVAHSTIN